MNETHKKAMIGTDNPEETLMAFVKESQSDTRTHFTKNTADYDELNELGKKLVIYLSDNPDFLQQLESRMMHILLALDFLEADEDAIIPFRTIVDVMYSSYGDLKPARIVNVDGETTKLELHVKKQPNP